MTARLAWALWVSLAMALAGAPGAAAQPSGDPTKEPPPFALGLTVPRSYDVPPPGMKRTAREVIRIASRSPRVRAEVVRHDDELARAYVLASGRWRVSWFVPEKGGPQDRREIVQTLVDDDAGRVLEVWTGIQIDWPMARGYPGQFGRAVNAPYVWIALCLLFVMPFARPPWRMLHLDLAVLLGFSVGYAFFNDVKVGVSTTLATALLVYLLARMLWVAWRRASSPPDSWMPTDALAISLVFLLGFRVALNVVNGNVIDVGFSGVIGADRITRGEAIYGDYPASNPHFDTYGPVNYLLYVPFELIFPWSGRWDALPAAHAAAIVFDLAVVAALFALGRHAADTRRGLLLAHMWAAFPFSVLVLNSSANDAIVGALLVVVLLVAARPVARGATLALAGLTKFGPLALGPLFFAPGRLRFFIGFGATAIAAGVPAFLGGGSEAFLDRTFGFQAGRDSPFSIWGYYGGLEAVRLGVQWGAILFALSLAVIRRPADTVGTAALAAAVLIALQLSLSYWFYLYLAWFVPLLLVALLVPRERVPGSARSSPPVAAASSG